MQATLLGVAIAIILALVAALVGPLFIDWSQYRGVFEARASRIVGMPVRVTGPIDARILPTPSVVLRGLEVGERVGEARVKARELGIEFALAPMLRGELRAVEVRLVGPDVRVALDAGGRLDWPQVQAGIDPGQLSIERLAIEDGRVVLADGRSDAAVTLEKLWFNGDLRSLAGPVKGEGGFNAEGERYFYRVSANRAGEDGATKVRLALDPSEHPLTIQAEGALRVETDGPAFEGTLTLARPAGIAPASGRGVAAVPWRATGRVKATSASALFEQVEFLYGPEERAIKLAGVADVRLGKSPRVNGILSGREIDLDRAFDLPESIRRLPVPAIRAMAETISGGFKPPFPVQLGIAVDSATLAGAEVQAVRGDFKIDADGLDIETFEMRAPGSTQLRLSGRLAFAGAQATFAGPATIDATNPRAFAAWLEGRDAPPRDQLGPMRASGDVAFSAGRIAIDRFKAEVDRKAIEGRLLYAWAADGRPPRLEAELKAASLDIDRVVAVGRAAFAGATPELPGQIALAIEIGRATIAGVEAKDADVKLHLDAGGLVLERVAFGDLGGAALNLSGRIESPFSAPHGAVTLDLDARALDGSLALLAKFAPDAAEMARTISPRLVPIKAHANLSLAADAAGASRLTVDGTTGPVRVRVAAQGNGDPSTLAALDIRLDAEASADDGGVLVRLLGLDRTFIVDKQPGKLSLAAQGPLNGDIRIDARLAAGGLAGRANGTARLLGQEAGGGVLDVTVTAADVRLPRRDAGKAPDKLPIALTTRLTVGRSALTFDDIAGTLAAVPMHGRLEAALGEPVKIDGRLDVDNIDVPALVAATIGAPSQTAARGAPALSSEPFAPGLFGLASARVRLSTTRAELTPGLAVRQARVNLRTGESEIALEDIEGDLAAGRLTGAMTFRRTVDGVAAHGRLALADADAAAVLPGEGRAAVTGRLGVQVEADGGGLSPAALLGSLTGTGTATLTDGEIAGFDPTAFDAVIRAFDQGAAVDAAKVRDIATAALDRGSLRVARADDAFSIAAGQVRLSTVIVHGEGADLSVAGHYDFVDRRLDARLTFSGAEPEGGGAGRPAVYVAIQGALGATQRTIDVTALSAWLTLRAVDREAKRIDAIEAAARDAAINPNSQPTTPDKPAAPVPPPQQALPRPPSEQPPARRPAAAPPIRPEASVAPALPPPIYIRPAPSAARPKTPAPAGAAGPAAARQNAPARPPAETPPPPPGRTIFDQLFGPQR